MLQFDGRDSESRLGILLVLLHRWHGGKVAQRRAWINSNGNHSRLCGESIRYSKGEIPRLYKPPVVRMIDG